MGLRSPRSVFLLALPLIAFAQSTSPVKPSSGDQTPTFRSQVDVVNVLTTVRDKKGQILSNLGQNDFKLEDNGQP
jgi:hypothetical protein